RPPEFLRLLVRAVQRRGPASGARRLAAPARPGRGRDQRRHGRVRRCAGGRGPVSGRAPTDVSAPGRSAQPGPERLWRPRLPDQPPHRSPGDGALHRRRLRSRRDRPGSRRTAARVRGEVVASILLWPVDWSFQSRVIGAGILGAWAVSLVTHLYFAIRWPRSLGDGQYAMIFCLTVPAGWLLGSLAGAVYGYRVWPGPHPAIWKIGLTIIAGLLATPLVFWPLLWLTVALPAELITRLRRLFH